MSKKIAVPALCLSFALVSCGGTSSTVPSNPVAPTLPPPPTVFTIQPSSGSPVLTAAQRSALNFQYGPPDGTIGVLLNGGIYTFFMAARSSSSCTGTPAVQGTYRFSGSLSSITAPYPCSAQVTPSANGDPNGYTFDQDYAGGGPVLAVTSATGASGLLHIYHGEAHGGTCGTTGHCTYASLGMAFSQNGGATFSKIGEIVQPYLTRSAILGTNQNLDIGGGTLVIADGTGAHIANLATADPSNMYLYVFYSDRDPSAATGSACNQTPCIALARAPLATVVADAFAGNTAAFPGLFRKFYNGGFTEPATSGDPNAATNSGHYTPVIATPGSFSSVLYDASTQQYLIAYTTGNNAISLQHGPTLLSWSGPITSGAISDGTNTILYPTLVGEGTDPATGNGDPWLFYIDATAWPSWPSATLVSRRLQLTYK
ncbi:hypothetical protein [Terriglobus sp.]|uniref:hypothetical protein n=1 Tax=Terriglobus sp. TaxID=1889013 RepID=UPI003AFFE80A